MILVAALETWLTPLWILGLGAALGLLLLAATVGIIALCGRHAREVAFDTLRNGIMLPTVVVACVLTCVCVLGLARVDFEPLLTSLSRLASSGETTMDFEIPAKADRESIDIAFRGPELRRIEIFSDVDVVIETNTEANDLQPTILRLTADEPVSWQRGSKKAILFRDDVAQMSVTNPEEQPARLTVTLELGAEHHEVSVVPWVAGVVPVVFLLCFGLRMGFPKTAAIALTTGKEAVSQPLFLIVIAVGAFAILAFIYIPYFSFGQDIRVLKYGGMTLIKVLSIILAMWTASVAVADEIEGRTALTLMSKPISRREFIMGKFLGIVGPVFLVFLILGVIFLATVSYKVVYDARESAKAEPFWQLCNAEMIQTVPGLVLAFFEAIILTAISIAISTRLGMLPNLIIIASIYVLGHLMPPLVQSSMGTFPVVSFLGQLIATILPVLDHFDVQAAVSGSKAVPWDYVGYNVAYAVLYCGVAMLVALVLFEDRDVA